MSPGLYLPCRFLTTKRPGTECTSPVTATTFEPAANFDRRLVLNTRVAAEIASVVFAHNNPRGATNNVRYSTVPVVVDVTPEDVRSSHGPLSGEAVDGEDQDARKYRISVPYASVAGPGADPNGAFARGVQDALDADPQVCVLEF